MASLPILVNNGWLSVPWAEYITEHAGSPGGSGTGEGAFSYEGGNQQIFTIYVNWSDRRQAIDDILGTNLFNKDTLNLDRTLPANHPDPEFSNLYAARITMLRGVKWLGKIVTEVLGPRGGGIQSARSDYQWALISILFTQPRYNIISDADLDRLYGAPRQEWVRFVEYVPQPAAEVLTVDANQFSWGETAAGGPTLGAGFPSTLAQFLSKEDKILLWRRVPVIGLFSVKTSIPDNLINGYNKVNDAAFFGYPAGTLLLKAIRFTPVEDPIKPAEVNAGLPGKSSLCFDVELVMAYFDPPFGKTLRGHNLAPFRGDNKWYAVTSNGAAPAADGSNTIFRTYTFTKLFQLQM